MLKLGPSGDRDRHVAPSVLPAVASSVATVPTVLVAHPGAELYGSDRMMLESVSAMVEVGWDVVVTLPVRGPLAAAVRARGGRVVQAPTPVLRKSALRPRGMVSLAAETARSIPGAVGMLRSVRPDAVYVSTVTIPLWIPVARAMGVPVVAHVHEAEQSAPALVRRALASPLLLANGVVVNSRFSRDVMAGSLPSLGRRCEVLYNGVEGPEHPTAAREVVDSAVRLLYVGRLSPRKGIDVAVEALADLVDSGTDAHLDLLGAVFEGYEWFERDLVELAQRRGVLDRLTFLGFQPDVWGHAAAADILLVPSRFDEPFGNTAVEAVLAARPAIVSDTSGLREAVDGYLSAQTVKPGSATAIAEAVRHVVANWSTYRGWAVKDAVIAADRHAPWRYRDQVAAAVRSAAPRLAAAPTPAEISLCEVPISLPTDAVIDLTTSTPAAATVITLT